MKNPNKRPYRKIVETLEQNDLIQLRPPICVVAANETARIVRDDGIFNCIPARIDSSQLYFVIVEETCNHEEIPKSKGTARPV